MKFLLFRYYLNLKKGVVIKLNIIESPCIQRCLVPSLVEIWQVVLEKMKMLKVNRLTDGRQTTGDHKSLIELSAQVSYRHPYLRYCLSGQFYFELFIITAFCKVSSKTVDDFHTQTMFFFLKKASFLSLNYM